MLPPMIYRVINPSLGGLENEGAYLLISKEVLPLGMLGLMLGAMIFATASSVNTTLNLAASVITNDLFKVIKPKASIKETMRVAKLSTLFFGIATIIVALLVPAAGGIVNVVISIGALTAASLYAPPIWALFSKKLSGKSILQVTVISLAINLVVKLFATELFGASLSTSNEMILGTGLPFVLLLIYEVVAAYRNTTSQDYLNYLKLKVADEIAEEDSTSQNTFGFKVLSITLLVVGVLILILSFLANESRGIIIVVGSIIILISSFIHPTFRQKITFKSS